MHADFMTKLITRDKIEQLMCVMSYRFVISPAKVSEQLRVWFLRWQCVGDVHFAAACVEGMKSQRHPRSGMYARFVSCMPQPSDALAGKC